MLRRILCSEDRALWQPISTAPKDGKQILLSNGLVVAEGLWINDEGGTIEHRDIEGRYIGQDDRDGYIGWMDYDGGMTPEPTHWMPLPEAPCAVIKRVRTLAPTRETAPALSDLKHAGDMLANCAFNLAQDGALSERARETLTQCRKAWDDARKADRAQQGVNPTMTREELVAAAESIGMRFAVFSGSFGDQPSPGRADREQRPAALREATDRPSIEDEKARFEEVYAIHSKGHGARVLADDTKNWARMFFNAGIALLAPWVQSPGADREREPVARILHWIAPSHIPVPFGGTCARTFREFPKNAGEGENGYWKEGEPLFAGSAPLTQADKEIAWMLSSRLAVGTGNIPIETGDAYAAIGLILYIAESDNSKADGYKYIAPSAFVGMFCATHKGCTPETIITRIEFSYHPVATTEPSPETKL